MVTEEWNQQDVDRDVRNTMGSKEKFTFQFSLMFRWSRRVCALTPLFYYDEGFISESSGHSGRNYVPYGESPQHCSLQTESIAMFLTDRVHNDVPYGQNP